MHIFEYGKNREGYWDGDNMCEHTDEVMDAVAYKYPDIFHTFYFDWSSGQWRALVGFYGQHRSPVARSNWLLWPAPQVTRRSRQMDSMRTS